jgi:hypothetical protein
MQVIPIYDQGKCIWDTRLRGCDDSFFESHFINKSRVMPAKAGIPFVLPQLDRGFA